MDRTKYPRTMNLPWSGSETSDDVWWNDTSILDGMEVVVTEKLDGECTSIYPDGFVHARSVDSKHHPSRSWIKALASGICGNMSHHWRLCGENMFAWHSIFYTELPTYFFLFGVYEGRYCLSWSETEDIADMLGIPTAPVIWRGIWDEEYVRNKWKGEGAFPTFGTKVDPGEKTPEFPDDFEPCQAEGYVVRIADTIPYDQFSTFCAKYVRPQHVQTDQFWMQRPVVRNLLQS